MILLTGANGFLGKYIFSEIIKTDQVLTLGRKNASIVCDLSSHQFKIDQHIDIVIHCAGLAHVFNYDKCTDDRFYSTNVVGTNNLLLSLEKSNCLPKYFLYISSVSVYGLSNGENIDESNPLLAKDSYGRSKIEAELIIIKWCNENNIICTILRLPLIVGENPPGNLGSMIIGIRRGYYFNIAGGNARKSMVLAEDIAKYIKIISKIGGIYNLTDGIHPSFKDLSLYISKFYNVKFIPNIPLFLAKLFANIGDKFGPDFPINNNKLKKINSTLTFDDSKARLAFGWNPNPVINGFKLNRNVK